MWRTFRRFKRDECFTTRERLSSYVDQRLSPEEQAQVEEHLQGCQGCRKELESLQATLALLHRLPEVTPSRSFTVAPVAPVPGQRVLRALRFATAGAALLLLVAFAADWTDLLQQSSLSKRSFGPSQSFLGPTKTAEEGESYWVVAGVQNSVDAQPETPVELVLPDGTDNVYAAVDRLALKKDGVLYGNTVSFDDVPKLVLTEGEQASAGAGEVRAFAVVSVAGEDSFATNGTFTGSAFKDVIEGQTGSYLNILSSDNSELYSFDLEAAKKESKAAADHDWLTSLVYGLTALVVVLGGATLAFWFKQRRWKTAKVS